MKKLSLLLLLGVTHVSAADEESDLKEGGLMKTGRVGRAKNIEELSLRKMKEWFKPRCENTGGKTISCEDPAAVQVSNHSMPAHNIILIAYGKSCSHCLELLPMQDKAAKKVKEESKKAAAKLGADKEVLFYRIDTFTMGGHAVGSAWQERFGAEAFQKEEKDGVSVPSMYLLQPHTITRVDHSQIGWAKEGHKLLRGWVKKTVGYAPEKKKQEEKDEL